jgi:hypothetical protein
MDRFLPRPIALLLAGLSLVAVAYAGQLVGHGGDGSAGYPAWCLALGASLVLAAMLSLAAGRPGGTPRALRVTALLAGVATFGGLAYALAARAPTPDGPLLLGLPRVTAIMLLVTGLVPLVVLPLAYARAFERDVLGEGDVERVVAAARAARAASAAAAPAED